MSFIYKMIKNTLNFTFGFRHSEHNSSSIRWHRISLFFNLLNCFNFFFDSFDGSSSSILLFKFYLNKNIFKWETNCFSIILKFLTSFSSVFNLFPSWSVFIPSILLCGNTRINGWHNQGGRTKLKSKIT